MTQSSSIDQNQGDVLSIAQLAFKVHVYKTCRDFKTKHYINMEFERYANDNETNMATSKAYYQIW